MRIEKLEEGEKVMRNFMKFKNDATFLNLANRLKDQELVSISHSELERIKLVADQDFQIYKNNVQDLRKMDEEGLKLNDLKKDVKRPNPFSSDERKYNHEANDQQDDSLDQEWNKLMASLNTFKPELDDYKLKGALERFDKKN